MQTDGKIVAGGLFSNIGGQTRNNIARLDPTTGLADSFNPNANERIYSITVQADGKIVVGGVFTSIGGQTRNHIARLDGTTGLADSFDPNANGNVQSIAVQADGKILAGGMFSSIGGQTRSLFARLTNDTAALQNLAVTQTTITWTLGGSSLQFTRVIFEYSADNVTYTFLGNGTATGNSWILTGLNLPTGQNIYIRARGYYRCGFSQRLGEHHGIGAECVSEWGSVANADGNCNSYADGNCNRNAERHCETQSDGEATSYASASPIGQFYNDVGGTESVRWYQTALGDISLRRESLLSLRFVALHRTATRQVLYLLPSLSLQCGANFRGGMGNGLSIRINGTTATNPKQRKKIIL